MVWNTSPEIINTLFNVRSHIFRNICLSRLMALDRNTSFNWLSHLVQVFTTQLTIYCSRLKLKVENTIRWRDVLDKDGNMEKESNSRFIRWSDGSMSLHLGCEIFDVHKQPLQVNFRSLTFLHCGVWSKYIYGNKISWWWVMNGMFSVFFNFKNILNLQLTYCNLDELNSNSSKTYLLYICCTQTDFSRQIHN